MKTINNLLVISILTFSFTFFSCKKEEKIEEEEKVVVTGEVVPGTFTKKVLIEEFSGEWCGNCPDGASIIEGIIQANPNRVYAAAVHQGDFLQISQFSELNSFLSVTAFPRSAIDRVPATNTTNSQNGLLAFSRSQWSAHVTKELQKAAIVGLKLKTSLVNDKLNVDVISGANQNLSNVYLTVYVTEDDIAESSAGAQSGAATGYVHQEVLVKVLSAAKGDAITLESGMALTKSYNDIALTGGINKANIKVLAFIHYHNTTTNTYEVLNVQEVHGGSDKDWN
jgi:thiol-disulfide isomerase/thioredoxin